MPISVVMPALEMAQETGKLVAWRKNEGAAVAKGEILLEIETDKAVMEIESPGDGILTGVSVHEGAEVPVGQTIAWLLKPGEQIPTQTAPAESGRHTSTGPSRPVATSSDVKQPSASAAAKISPKARRLAQEHGIDVTRLRGSGPDGAVVVEDVLALVQSAQSAPAKPAISAELPALSTVARLMAERTTQSWTHVPHFFLVQDVDATALIETRKKLGSAIEEARGVRPTFTDFLVTYAARALTKHPRLNSSWVDGGIRRNSAVNIAIAIAVEDGVVSGVIRDAANLDLGQIAVQRKDLSERAQAGRLRPSDISDATFTISNLGMYGVDAFSAIITPPQAAILAVGRIADRVVAVNGKPYVRPMMTLTLSSDHRVVDGARAAAFLKDLAAEIEEHPQDEP
jgi:pyruvate dehydrogenase E2 component (dihydrolipoyllysine-residue acetyltransferase)